jgi:hypothetical protein
MSKSIFPDDLAVVTSTFVMNDKMPILIVTHEDDEEGGSLWQFHCGNDDYDMEKMLLVSLNTIFSFDPSIRQVLDLPKGQTATRQSVSSEWHYS